jgi:hypothetical protein
VLVSYSDSDWAGDIDTRHSTSGLLALLNGGPVAWWSCKQNLVSTSTTEAEYIGLSSGAKEVIYIRQLLDSMGFTQETTSVLFGDNKGANFLCDNPKTALRTKHIEIKFHHIRTLVETKQIKIEYISIEKTLVFHKPRFHLNHLLRVVHFLCLNNTL